MWDLAEVTLWLYRRGPRRGFATDEQLREFIAKAKRVQSRIENPSSQTA